MEEEGGGDRHAAWPASSAQQGQDCGQDCGQDRGRVREVWEVAERASRRVTRSLEMCRPTSVVAEAMLSPSQHLSPHHSCLIAALCSAFGFDPTSLTESIVVCLPPPQPAP